MWHDTGTTNESGMNISTHTPLARCGIDNQKIWDAIENFNSHTPREVWPFSPQLVQPLMSFQLTHPSRGVAVTNSAFCVSADDFNSHTPREVWLRRSASQRCFPNFNSHTPREVWPLRIFSSPTIGIFQLTHPSRGVAISRTRRRNISGFQLTHPSRGVA